MPPSLSMTDVTRITVERHFGENCWTTLTAFDGDTEVGSVTFFGKLPPPLEHLKDNIVTTRPEDLADD